MPVAVQRDPASTGMRADVEQMRAIALRALPRMYRPEERLFAFRIRRAPLHGGQAPGRAVLEGVSRRYTAIVLIGLATEDADVAAEILAGASAESLVQRWLAQVDQLENLGDVALLLWAARMLECRASARAAARLKALRPLDGPHPTVELSWALTALCVGESGGGDAEFADAVFRRLLACFRPQAGMFTHLPPDAPAARWRSHVACFADLVYPIQALSYYYIATGRRAALDAARRCAQRICDAQGPAGQWWWHYDVRSGRVLEGYPVYSVHQDAMAPMALFALQDACGQDVSVAVERGVRWLTAPPETSHALIDDRADLIWRKVARHEPRKLARGVQAMASRVHPRLRVPGLGAVLWPGAIDYECRPYHLGWLLHAWPASRVAALGVPSEPTRERVGQQRVGLHASAPASFVA
jgi:hypothetical protein